jgi:hypothetical protein
VQYRHCRLGDCGASRCARIDDGEPARAQGRIGLEERQEQDAQQHGGEVVDLDQLLMSRTGDYIEVGCLHARVEDSDVEAGELGVGAASKGLNGVVGFHFEGTDLDVCFGVLSAERGRYLRALFW